LFDLAGGPGNAVTGSAQWYVDESQSVSRFRRHRDVVLVDQRGTGRSNPLNCTTLESGKPLDPVYPTREANACRDALAADSDLSQYTSENAARDLDRVREALGYGQMDIWAISYGTVLAQVYLKRFPARIRSAVLVGTAPMDNRSPLFHAANAQRVLDRLFLACESDSDCRSSYPELRQEWVALLKQIDRAPLPVAHKDTEPALTSSGTIEREVFGEKLRNVLYSTGGQRLVPWLVHRAAGGDYAPLLEELSLANGGSSALGLYFSVTCSEGTARIEPGEVDAATAHTFLGQYRVQVQTDACAAWPKSVLPGDFFEPVRSDVPVLLLAGEMDVVTPPAWAELVAKKLLNSRVVRFAHAGHIFWEWGPGIDHSSCYDDLAEQLYARGNVAEIDTSCAINIVLPPFYVPENGDTDR
jgi:pimeloyl-ACP methyl ester carboxylesterase